MEELDPYLHQQFWGGHNQQQHQQHQQSSTEYHLLNGGGGGGLPGAGACAGAGASSPSPRRRSLSAKPEDILAGMNPAGSVSQFNHSIYDIDNSIEWTHRDIETFMTFFGRSCSPVSYHPAAAAAIPRPSSSLSGGGCSLATDLTLDDASGNTLLPEHLVEAHQHHHPNLHHLHQQDAHNHGQAHHVDEGLHATDQYDPHSHSHHHHHNNHHFNHGRLFQASQLSNPVPIPDRKPAGYKAGKRFKGFQIKLVTSPTTPTPSATGTAASKKRRLDETDDEDRSEEQASKMVKSTHTPTSTSPSPGLVQFSIIPPELAKKGGHGALKELSAEEKRSKALVRQHGGGCFRCRMLNKKGSPHLCFRLDLEDCSFFRSDTPIHIVPVSEHTKIWATDNVLELKFHCVPLKVSSYCEPLVVNAREFVPQPGDNLNKSPGGRHPDQFILVRPYIASSSDEMYKTLLTRMASYRNAFRIDMIMHGTSPVTISIMDLADHLSKLRPHGIIHCALDIWVGAHLNATERSLCGDELLGMPPNIIDDATSFLFGYVPIPPQLDNQLDNLIIKGMVSNASHLLKTIWTKFKAKKKTDWLELWVTTYIILNTVEFVLKSQQAYVEYLGSTFHRDKILAHWDRHRNLWSWSGNHLVDAFEYYHKKLDMPMGPLLRKDSLSDAQTYTDIRLDNEAFRMLRQIGENIQVAVRTQNLETAERPRTPKGRAEYETMWTSRIIFVR
ncbi:hypothetical protein H072_6031 [Dactylellina haptotyla CBS 200.50]|uniref:Uncharacterized protein n=1 Tax=Dactylellina haptotyla (strain CBS 200.50) TaxID=1284197 RepID=S8AB56_DACHA|nr:hypothetical protein H072_6031 [Dactylellina haptotyla CBS 200.50]